MLDSQALVLVPLQPTKGKRPRGLPHDSGYAATAIRQQPNYLAGQRIMMACHAAMGRLDEARASCAAVMQIDPSQRVSRDKAWGPFQRPQDMKKLKEAFLIAGMPQ